MRRQRLFFSTMLGLAVAVVAACSSADNGSPLEPSTAPGLLAAKGRGDGLQLVECKPLPAATTTATIGVFGGVIKVGPHRLIVPPGALLTPKTITAKIVAGDATNSVQFYPEGLKFTATALLAISYDNCKHKGMFDQLQVVYTSNDLLNILELLPSVTLPLDKTVIGNITHFSRYAIAY